MSSGAGLAFVAYPDLVTRMAVSPLWAVLFFSMLFTLGLDSQFAIVETILTGILDFKPDLRAKKTFVVGGICIVGFLCGIPLTTEGGGYLIDLVRKKEKSRKTVMPNFCKYPSGFLNRPCSRTRRIPLCMGLITYIHFLISPLQLDYYAAGWPYLFIGFTELIIISHVYGIQNFLDDLYHIMKFNPGLKSKVHFMFLYMTLSPLIIFVSTSIELNCCYLHAANDWPREFHTRVSQTDAAFCGPHRLLDRYPPSPVLHLK